MRALRFALVAALISVSVLESSDAFAGSAAGGTGGGAAGAGASGGTGGGGGGGGGGVAPFRALSVVIDKQQTRPHPYEHRQTSPAWTFSSCFKQDELYDRYGNPVVNLHGVACYGQ
jgi:hypothetical protein